MSFLTDEFVFRDVSLLGGEGDAHLGDGTPVRTVLVGVAALVNLLECLVGGVVILDFDDVDALGHFQDDVGTTFR